jgi:hypothetical protein
MEYAAVESEDAKRWPYVWSHGFMCGYYGDLDKGSVPASDHRDLDIARHMEESMSRIV